MDELAPQNWCFLNPVFGVYQYRCQLILLPPGVGWHIMGYESYPLHSYIKLSNCSYSIMLNCTYSPFTPRVHLPSPGPTISSSGLSLAFAPSQRRVHKWGFRLPFLLWFPDASITLMCSVIWNHSILKHNLHAYIF